MDKGQAPDPEHVYTDKENCKGTAAKVPEQPNGCDCGLYVMHFAKTFLSKADEILRHIEKVSERCFWCDRLTQRLIRTRRLLRNLPATLTGFGTQQKPSRAEPRC